MEHTSLEQKKNLTIPVVQVNQMNFKRLLTNILTVGTVAERQHRAHSLGVGLLHQQLDNGLSVRFNQVLTLGSQGGGQNGAHRLHSVNNLLLVQERQK